MPRVTDVETAVQVLGGELRKYQAVLVALGSLPHDVHETIDTSFTTVATAAVAWAEAQKADAPAEAE